jgi:hypothetical protein
VSPEAPPESGRLRAWFLAEAAATPPAGGCSGRDRIWEAALGSLPAPERTILLDHAADCASCAEVWRLAREVIAGAGSALFPAAGRAPHRHRSVVAWAWGLPTAAAAALLVVLVAPRLLRDAAPPAAFRDEGAASLASLVPSGAALPRDAFVLSWSPGPPGSLYDVEVATSDVRTVASAEGLDAARYRVPAEALAHLPAGTRLLWRVEALLPDGTRIASPAFHVSLR